MRIWVFAIGLVSCAVDPSTEAVDGTGPGNAPSADGMTQAADGTPDGRAADATRDVAVDRPDERPPAPPDAHLPPPEPVSDADAEPVPDAASVLDAEPVPEADRLVAWPDGSPPSADCPGLDRPPTGEPLSCGPAQAADVEALRPLPVMPCDIPAVAVIRANACYMLVNDAGGLPWVDCSAPLQDEPAPPADAERHVFQGGVEAGFLEWTLLDGDGRLLDRKYVELDAQGRVVLVLLEDDWGLLSRMQFAWSGETPVLTAWDAGNLGRSWWWRYRSDVEGRSLEVDADSWGEVFRVWFNRTDDGELFYSVDNPAAVRPIGYESCDVGGRVTARAIPYQFPYRQTYDACGRPIRADMCIPDPDSGEPLCDFPPTRWTYDAAGRLAEARRVIDGWPQCDCADEVGAETWRIQRDAEGAIRFVDHYRCVYAPWVDAEPESECDLDTLLPQDGRPTRRLCVGTGCEVCVP